MKTTTKKKLAPPLPPFTARQLAKLNRPTLWHDDGKGYRGQCTPTKHCPAMRLALADNRRHERFARGITSGIGLHNIGNTRKVEAYVVLVYMLKPNDGGMELNFCPFCGGVVRPDKGYKPGRPPSKPKPARAAMRSSGTRGR